MTGAEPLLAPGAQQALHWLIAFSAVGSFFVLPQLVLRRARRAGWAPMDATAGGAILGLLAASLAALGDAAIPVEPAFGPLWLALLTLGLPFAPLALPDRASLVALPPAGPWWVANWRLRFGVATGLLLGVWTGVLGSYALIGPFGAAA